MKTLALYYYKNNIINDKIRMLDIIKEKLVQMTNLAEIDENGNLSVDEVESINTEINNLAEQARALDEESRKFDDNIEYK